MPKQDGPPAKAPRRIAERGARQRRWGRSPAGWIPRL